MGEFGSVAMNKRIFKKQTTKLGDVPFYKIGTFGKKPDAYISNELFEEYKSKYPYPETGDLLISASGSIGRIVEYKGQKAYFQDSNIVWLKHNDQLNNLFLKAFYHIVKWDGTEGSTIKRLYNKNILRTKISLPTVLEQEKIGEIIEHIEQLTALQQRKIDLLIQISKVLSKITQPKLTTINGIMLKEFVNVKIKTINTSKLKKNKYLEYSMPAFDNNEVPQIISSKNIRSSKILIEKPVILFNKLNVRKRRVWNLKKIQTNAIASTEFIPLELKPSIDQNYLYFLLKSDYVTAQMIARSTGSSNSQKRIRKEDLLSIRIRNLPSIEKQRKIANILLNYEKLIHQNKEIKKILLSLKKSLLQQMFI
ncbi:restriction endonuclease subunit S [Limosilactobacillus fastidiosus]|uniref:Restriction endonuclease subunit S n=1 Tax=Limosilactobacillus fastidiosus TaxID=2759855 RepID=A0ABR6E530_9LACO|nr:restriction endonuclease subunit S [Limosilactobacillus fastidiosus]MCD7083368.1 restriction endonuclease subunit S [Limosilactobacillus fastidiosus]